MNEKLRTALIDVRYRLGALEPALEKILAEFNFIYGDLKTIRDKEFTKETKGPELNRMNRLLADISTFSTDSHDLFDNLEDFLHDLDEEIENSI